MAGNLEDRQDRLRSLPSLDVLLRRPGVEDLEREHGRQVVRDALRALDCDSAKVKKILG